MNKLIIMGNLGRDAERRNTTGGTAILSWSIAVKTGYGQNETTQWFNCSLFGKRAEGGLADFLVKGQSVVVEGEVTLNEFDTEAGHKCGLNVFVKDVYLAGKRSEPAAAAPADTKPDPAPSGRTVNPDPDGFDDDVPF